MPGESQGRQQKQKAGKDQQKQKAGKDQKIPTKKKEKDTKEKRNPNKIIILIKKKS